MGEFALSCLARRDFREQVAPSKVRKAKTSTLTLFSQRATCLMSGANKVVEKRMKKQAFSIRETLYPYVAVSLKTQLR